jgi:hypothetical protein
MRDTKSLHSTMAPSATSTGPAWFPGLPHAALGLATGPVFGWPACLMGLLLAALTSFVVYLPLTALALNGGRPIGPDDPSPPFNIRARTVLLGLWTATAWGGAALSAWLH